MLNCWCISGGFGVMVEEPEFAMGGCFGGLGAETQLPEANGGLDAKAQGPGGGAPTAQKFCIYLQK